METLPTELYTPIFNSLLDTQAKTIQNLCLVSSHFYLSARPLLFNSLRITSFNVLASLLSTIQDLPPDERKIEHLQLELDAIDPTQTTNLLHIMHLAAPTLRSLVVRLPTTNPLSAVIISHAARANHFSNLEKLDLTGFFNLQQVFGSLRAPKLKEVILQTLQPLRLSGADLKMLDSLGELELVTINGQRVVRGEERELELEAKACHN
ncbi:hypothetical protein DL96DRAFT_395896 [Flagelloscypha sp. PMI_526]|nr:hypothetical protein DL96DRAFT_395896 [Flagelloscypha sp. PMI_526]